MLAHVLLHDVRDVEAASATVTRVRVTSDLRLARVFFGLMEAGAHEPEVVRKALMRVVPFLRRKLAAELELRFTPELEFFFDEELADARRVDDLLRSLRRDEFRHGGASDDEGKEDEQKEDEDPEREP